MQIYLQFGRYFFVLAWRHYNALEDRLESRLNIGRIGGWKFSRVSVH